MNAMAKSLVLASKCAALIGAISEADLHGWFENPKGSEMGTNIDAMERAMEEVQEASERLSEEIRDMTHKRRKA